MAGHSGLICPGRPFSYHPEGFPFACSGSEENLLGDWAADENASTTLAFLSGSVLYFYSLTILISLDFLPFFLPYFFFQRLFVAAGIFNRAAFQGHLRLGMRVKAIKYEWNIRFI